jgi:hypothetical protein
MINIIIARRDEEIPTKLKESTLRRCHTGSALFSKRP